MHTCPAPRERILGRTDPAAWEARARRLLSDLEAGRPEARSLLLEFHPDGPRAPISLDAVRLALARSCDHAGWPELVRAVELFNAILDDDPTRVLERIRAHPPLLHERVNGRTSSWGAPLACSAQVGSPAVLAALLPLEGQDLDAALGRAILKGRESMARALIAHGAELAPGEVMGPCESLNVAGLRFLAEIGAPLTDEHADPLAPVALLLEGYARDPEAKHACLAFFEEHGVELPDTPPMAFHRGRLDRLRDFLAADPKLLERRFSHREVWPPELGCHTDESLALHGTPLAGTTLLHMTIDYDEVEIARWLLARGADVDARAETDDDGFGGHTPLFQTVVSQAWRAGRQRDPELARSLLERGADPNARASLRKRLRFVPDERKHFFRDVTPIAYGQAFHAPAWVSTAAIAAIAERGGG